MPVDAAAPGPLWLLMYHSVAYADHDPYRITVTPDRLHSQLGWLRRRGLRGVSVGELLRARAAGRAARMVGLTFDDGYRDFLDTALPLLRGHGCTATVFVLPGRLHGSNAWDADGPRKRLLNADGIKAVAAAGMEIGSHGMRHVSLQGAADDVLEREVVDSRRRLTDLTGVPVQGFCYPYGAVDRRALAAVEDAGYGYGCAISPGRLTGRFALPRVHIGERDTGLRMRLKQALHPVRRRKVPPLPAPAAPAEPIEAR
ncbi:polysaccharide deacetylase family protein [Streptomyces sp. MP131-18]|uniref:polysaccharide deacetylase family protein n=1 Tax=Streptomyces sp. MP131-18 TaxID=1857892 RepID=UPI0009C6F91F|nr:polysaccharide deacetylase family protein [Streptomyces sp. MP131-18]ONK12764.1 Poly-beta-1,6-N-acetyl-D-glucosamine N-deacetylase precursor [Streptomyces sp. MP131-18]